MAQSVKFTLVKTPETTKPGVPAKTASRSREVVSPISFGRGLLNPFVRDGKGDFANSSDIEVVRGNLRQVLFTTCSSGITRGELPWRPEFGSVLETLRFLPLDEVTAELARTHVIDAIKTWLPRIRVRRSSVEADYDRSLLIMTVYYDILTSTSRSVLASNLSEAVEVPVAA